MRRTIMQNVAQIFGKNLPDVSLSSIFVSVLILSVLLPIFPIFTGNLPARVTATEPQTKRFILSNSASIANTNSGDELVFESVSNEEPDQSGADVKADLAEGSAAQPSISNHPASSDDGVGVLAIKFALPIDGQNSGQVITTGDGMIEVEKPLIYNSAQVGSIAIRIDDAAQLYLQTAQIKGLLSDEPTYAGKLDGMPNSGFVPIRRLRDAGVNLRYNPTTDQLIVQTN